VPDIEATKQEVVEMLELGRKLINDFQAKPLNSLAGASAVADEGSAKEAAAGKGATTPVPGTTTPGAPPVKPPTQ
jgi:hypothetical protein